MYEHAVLERHPAEPDLVSHRPSGYVAGAGLLEAGLEPSAQPRRAPSSRPSTAIIGMISRTAELVNASSARRSDRSVNEPSRIR